VDDCDMSETFEISPEQAEIYEQRFVPALFAQLAPWLVDEVGVREAKAVLDVACGTGIVGRTVADRIGAGCVNGVDLNEAMLTVARRLRPDVVWRHGDVADLPFADSTFNTVLCQSAMMFFPDATRALMEMARVAETGGAVGVQVFNRLDEQRAYGPWIEMVARHAGPEALNLLGTYWVHGDLDALGGRFADAGLSVDATLTREFVLAFDSIESFVRTEIGATPLLDRLTDGQFRAILDGSERVLGRFAADGHAAIPIAAQIVIGRKP
jgi:SAM-dependent methyltransferase